MYESVSQGTNMTISRSDAINGGITCTGDSVNYWNIIQYVNAAEKDLKGKTVTFSVIMQGDANGTTDILICNGQNINQQIGFKTITFTGNLQMAYVTVDIPSDAYDNIGCNISCHNSTNLYIKCMKLELGNIPTFIMPQNDEEERAKSQYFYQIVGKGCWFKASSRAGRLYLATPLQTWMTPNNTINISILGGLTTVFRGMVADANVTNINTSDITIFDNNNTNKHLGITFLGISCPNKTFNSGAMYSPDHNFVVLDARIYY